MKVARYFTQSGVDVFSTVKYACRDSRISNVDGSVVFEMKNAEVPEAWSQLATDIVVSKYFRKAGVPQVDNAGQPILDESGQPKTGPERSVRQVVHRLAGCWTHWGRQYGYFDGAEDAQAFYDEIAYMLLRQMAAPNSPQWFNTGLNFAYGLTGPAQGHWVTNPVTHQVEPAVDAYTHPQPHACFIQSVADDLVNEGGIMDLWVREARLFKYGSGTGANFSRLRGENEPLSGGGKSSGLMSFLRIGDRAAGAIKSGGTTRRAAKMVCLNLDHPDIEAFVNWKVREEIKVAAMVEGLKHLSKEQRQQAEQLGLHLDYDFNGEAYATVSGQNSNNSVRVLDRFIEALDADGPWELIRRTDGKVHKTLRARALWDQIAFAAWRCADPGVQFDDTINQWHTCPQSGRINASNPCSEYMFLDNTACNLASLNLMKFFDPQTSRFDVAAFRHACRLWTMVLEISVLMAAYPSREIARLSYEYRTLGLGYANLGTMLMVAGIAYDSPQARAICGAVTALLTAESYAASAEMARELGPFPGYHRNRADMLRVMRNHRAAACGEAYTGLSIAPPAIDATLFGTHPLASGELLAAAREAWQRAVSLGEKHGYRNAQTTVIAPTGTIGLLMDCDTTGVEPDFALVKFKKLAGGGYFKIANQSLEPALRNLGYSADQIKDILTYVLGTLTLRGAVHINTETLLAKGLTEAELAKIEACLPSVFELHFAFSPWTLGAEAMTRLGIEPQRWRQRSFNLLRALGFNRRQIREAGEMICGTQTVEGAPHLKPEHLSVFDCANKCGRKGQRFIHHLGHIKMMAAAQPFISGAISKTINLPNESSVADIKEAYRESWRLGLKAVALYRDGSKLSQPLNSTADDDAADDAEIEALKTESSAACATCGEPGAFLSGDGTIPPGGADTGSAGPGATVERIVEKVVPRPLRRRLPDTRPSITHKFDIAGHEGYITCGLFADGSPGEVFITMAKQGSTVGGLMDTIATLISLNLQYGVPLDAIVRKFEHMRFEPAGMTANPDIPIAKSPIDYLVRWLGMKFVCGYYAANAPARAPAVSADPTEADPMAAMDDAPKVAPAPSVSEDLTDLADAAPPAEPRHLGRGNGNGRHAASPASHSERSRRAVGSGGDRFTAFMATSMGVLSHQMATLMGDAPVCTCGSLTVRNGSCYKCLNCGNSLGCS